MGLSDIMKELRKNSSGRIMKYSEAEALVLCILQEYLKNQSKTISLVHRIQDKKTSISYEIDSLAPEGIDDLPAKTVIDINLKYDNEIVNTILNRFMKILYALRDIKSVLLIFVTELTEDKKIYIKDKLKFANDIKINIWDINDLLKISNSISDSESYIEAENLSQLLINSTVSNSLKNDINHWKELRKERIEELKQIYKNDDLVLFLGAGISKKAGIPDWNLLISELMVKMIEEKLKDNNININKTEQRNIIDEMKDFKDYSPLLQASYIKTGLGSNFEKEVSKSLYSGFSNNNKGTSDLLKSLVKLCIPRRSGVGIRSVVTYNFDDLMEVNLEEQNIYYKSILSEKDSANVDELGIYHVHGFIPRDPENYDLTDSSLVFSEKGYHTLYNEAYSWPNIVQLNSLRESTCLMVGLSMTDPNLRRLLSIATRKFEKPKHFVIMKRQSFLEISKETNIRNEILERFTIVNQELQETFFRDIGVNIIWVDNYEEIPQLLESIVHSPKRDGFNTIS